MDRKRRQSRLAWLKVIGFCAVLPLPAVAEPGWDLTPEDLELAFERGDLDADVYDQLLDLFRLRQATGIAAGDSTAMPTDIGRGDLDSLLRSSASAMPALRGAAYEIYRPLRGSATARDWLLLAPSVGSLRLHWELARSGPREWRVLRGQAWWQSSRLSILAGSFDLFWVDGLLVGVAPGFLKRRERFAETLLFPDRGRLNGMLCDVAAFGTRAALLVSRRDDDELTHLAYGLRVVRPVGGLQIETAYLRQMLGSPGYAAQFSSGIWGLEAQWRGRSRFVSGALAVSQTDWAAQGKLDVAQSESHRLAMTVWRVGTRFRNPLLDGAAESDREPVYYPEVDRTISSAATGERGGELRLQVGLPDRRSDFALRYWREHPGRSASLRAVAAHEFGRAGRRWRAEYRVYRRVEGVDVRHRHEWSLRATRSRGYCDVKLRRTLGSWSPFGEVGGRLEAGVRFGGGPAAADRQSLVLTYTDYDFALEQSAFWAVRWSQALELSRAVRLSMHVRWRAAYHAHPADLTLRITTRGAL